MSMVRMGMVWDRAVEVLRGRTDILVWIAAVGIFLPAVVNNALAAYGQSQGRAGVGAGFALLTGLVAIAVLLASIWGQLALLAVATHPQTTRSDAAHQATRRLGPALAVVIVLVLLFALLLVPPVIALVRAGVDVSNPAAMASIPPGASGFIGIYVLVLIPLLFWVSARLILVNPVVLNERRGLGAIRRSFQLTRGLTWRIIGVMLLFAVVLLVATLAVQAVTALVFRLILGADSLALVGFLAAAAGAVVTTAMSVVAAAFTAQLYVATTGDHDRPAETVG